MRTYEERAQYILKQRDERLAKRRRIRSAVTMSVVSVCSLALIVGVSAAINNVVGKNGGVRISPSESADPSGASGTADPQVTAPAAELVYNDGDIHSAYKFTMSEFPDVGFAIDNGVVIANGKKLFGGQITASVFLADLNGDGYRELCTDWGVSAPSTPLDMGISAYDYSNGEYYALSDPTGSSEYHLSLEDGKLKYKYYIVLKDQSIERKGEFTLSDMTRVSESYFINNGEDLSVEMIQIDTGSEFTMPELPDVNFTVNEEGALAANDKTLFGGKSFDTIYLADLNGDGYRELCTDWGIHAPSTPLYIGICAYDYLNDEYYALWDPHSEYSLLPEDGKLKSTYYVFLKDERITRKGEFTLSDMIPVSDGYFVKRGEALPAEWVYDRAKCATATDFTMPEFPGVNFKVDGNTVSADGRTLYSGMPISNVCLADLNGDGYREICSEIAFGSGIIDIRILAYDYAISEYCELYELSDRGKYDYTLVLEDGVLKYNKNLWNYLNSNLENDTPIETDILTLSVMKRVKKNVQEAPPAEKLYPSGNKDVGDILELNDDFEFTIPELSESSFKLEKGVLSRDGEFLHQGYPIHSIYLADLNGDGVREICGEYSVGEGVVDMNIFAYDPKTKELYTLSDTGNKEYVLTLENGVLGYKHCVYSSSGITTDEQGELTLAVLNRLCGLPKADPEPGASDNYETSVNYETFENY